MSKINHYELTSIIDPNIADDQHPNIIEKIKKMITKNEGEISAEENLGRKKLNYAIKNALKGVFICIEFDLDPAKLKNIEKELKLDKNILRYLAIKKPKNVKKIDINKLSDTPRKEEHKKTPRKLTPKKNRIEDEKKEEIKAAPSESDNQKDKEEKLVSSDDKIIDKTESEKSSLDELDEKLDKILNDEIIN